MTTPGVHVVEVLYEDSSTVIVDAPASEVAVAGVNVTEVVETAAAIGPPGPQGEKGDQGEPATAYVGDTPPPDAEPGDLWIQPVTFGVGEPAEVIISETQPEFLVPGLWIQTGLGPDGTGITFWIEDGV